MPDSSLCKSESCFDLFDQEHELLHRAIRSLEEHPEEAEVLRDTVSIGAAQWQSEESFESLAERADTRLYEAKRDGRNRVLA